MTGDPSLDDRRARYRGFGKERPQWYLKNGSRALYKEVVTRLRPRPQVAGRPIVILFTQRSGSTWLVELLRTLEGMVSLQDPILERNSFHYARLYGFPQRHYYYQPEDLAAATPFLRRVLELRRVAALDLDEVPHDRAARVRPVIKVSNAPWSDAYWRETFDAEVFRLMRHPVLAARSQMKFFRMPMHLDYSLGFPAVQERLSADQLAVCKAALASGDEKRQRICEVFLENLPAFGPAPAPTPLIHYEDLIARNFEALDFVASVDPDWRAKFEASFDRPSRSSTGGKVVGKTRRAELDAEEAAVFADCVAAFQAEAFLPIWSGEPEAAGAAPATGTATGTEAAAQGGAA
ncbi:hypothetical protein P2H44_25385 [Albimonas sp. CAU 1670]|uniref:hypothetical protein n=1 Tax=Albimonas sp. CAU 1670 TaxID=3032599 RepID=UPI0023DADCA6|nr:hypothetical protein [Albimonas sp. CAU 1670]MDF2235898.1 hypothetical protein [Albimonas sp. CAU 1670]